MGTVEGCLELLGIIRRSGVRRNSDAGSEVEDVKIPSVKFAGKEEFIDEAIEPLLKVGDHQAEAGKRLRFRSMQEDQGAGEDFAELLLVVGCGGNGDLSDVLAEGSKVATTDSVRDAPIKPLNERRIQERQKPLLGRWNEIAGVSEKITVGVEGKCLVLINVRIDDFGLAELLPVGNVILDFIPFITPRLSAPGIPGVSRC